MVNKRENINNVYIDKVYNRIILQFSYDIKENSVRYYKFDTYNCKFITYNYNIITANYNIITYIL